MKTYSGAWKSALVIALVTTGLATTGGAASAENAYGPPGVGTLEVPDLQSSPPTRCVSTIYEFINTGDAPDFKVEGDIVAPSGKVVQTFALTPGHETKVISFCPGRDQKGAYQVRAEYTGTPQSDPDGFRTLDYSTTLTYTTQKAVPRRVIAKAHRSKSKICPGKANSHCWLVQGRVTTSGKGVRGATLQLQAYGGGRWQTAASCRTNRQGWCGFYVQLKKAANKVPFRYLAPVTDDSFAAASKSFRMRY